MTWVNFMPHMFLTTVTGNLIHKTLRKYVPKLKLKTLQGDEDVTVALMVSMSFP